MCCIDWLKSQPKADPRKEAVDANIQGIKPKELLMKIKLADWASIAEILGAVAIVISLVFVGFQINDGNRETRAATTQAILDSEMFFRLNYCDTPTFG